MELRMPVERMFEFERKDWKDLVDLVYGRGIQYLEFIRDKGLLKDFFEWRRERLLKELGV